MSFKFTKKDNHINVFMNGEFYEKVEKIDSHNPSYLWEAAGKDYVINRMDDLSSKDFPSNFEAYDFYKSKNFPNLQFINLLKKDEELKVKYHISIDYKKWVNPFTVPTFIRSYEKKLIKLGYMVETVDEDYDSSISIIVGSTIDSQSITNSIEEFSIIAKSLYDEIENKLTKEYSENIITKIFNFPEDYQIICSQYLLWFGELLSDLGIKSSVSTENKNGKNFLNNNTRKQF